MTATSAQLPLTQPAASVKKGSEPSVAALGPNGRFGETWLALRTPLPAHSCRSDLRPNEGGAPGADWETCVRCRTLAVYFCNAQHRVGVGFDGPTDSTFFASSEDGEVRDGK
jgi:hypothetical protein